MPEPSSIEIPCITATPSSPRYTHSNRLNHIRPNSEVYTHKPTASPEAEVLEKWFEDLAQYERILEEMSKASLEPSFKEELGAVENWFSALSQAEKTAALYSLMHQSNNVQIRFFITVLQKMNKDPVRDILSPAFSRQSLQSKFLLFFHAFTFNPIQTTPSPTTKKPLIGTQCPLVKLKYLAPRLLEWKISTILACL